MGFYNPIYKNELFFPSKTHISTPFTQNIYGLLFTNMDIFQWRHGSRNILINSQLKKILFISSDKKKWNKTEKDTNDTEKENNSNESDFKENEIPDLNSLKQKQTSEILTVVAVIMRKKVLNIK